MIFHEKHICLLKGKKYCTVLAHEFCAPKSGREITENIPKASEMLFVDTNENQSLENIKLTHHDNILLYI
jgi:hypothetical protein